MKYEISEFKLIDDKFLINNTDNFILFPKDFFNTHLEDREYYERIIDTLITNKAQIVINKYSGTFKYEYIRYGKELIDLIYCLDIIQDEIVYYDSLLLNIVNKHANNNIQVNDDYSIGITISDDYYIHYDIREGIINTSNTPRSTFINLFNYNQNAFINNPLPKSLFNLVIINMIRGTLVDFLCKTITKDSAMRVTFSARNLSYISYPDNKEDKSLSIMLNYRSYISVRVNSEDKSLYNLYMSDKPIGNSLIIHGEDFEGNSNLSDNKDISELEKLFNIMFKLLVNYTLTEFLEDFDIIYEGLSKSSKFNKANSFVEDLRSI